MVGQRQASLYELLEVSSSATFEEIEQAYQRIAAYLGAESLAVYSILDSDDAHTARAQLDEAYRTLSDPDRRTAYDRSRKEDAGYPPLMVPANTGGSTSTAESHDHVRDSGEDERDKRLPLQGRSPAQMPIRGPATRTGRTPLYGRDVGRSAKANEPAEVERKKKPLYGRATPRSTKLAQESPAEESRGRLRGRADDAERFDAPLPQVSRHVADEQPEHLEEHHVEHVEVHAPARHEPQVRHESSRHEAAPPVASRSRQEEHERPELVKTASDVVEPRKRSTVPPPAQLSASAKSKRRVLSPSIQLELTGEVEYGGSLLRRLRESTGSSLEEVAEITKVGKRHLIAIETNDFAALPAAVYTRGFVAEYARVLGLDVDRVTRSFMALYAKYRGVGG